MVEMLLKAQLEFDPPRLPTVLAMARQKRSA